MTLSLMSYVEVLHVMRFAPQHQCVPRLAAVLRYKESTSEESQQEIN